MRRVEPSPDLNYGQWQLQLDTSNRKAAKLDESIRQQRLRNLQKTCLTSHGKVMFQNFADAVCQSVMEIGSLAAKGTAGPHFAAINWILQLDDPRQVAALALQTVIDSIAREIKWSTLVNRIGAVCETEARAGQLRTINPTLFKTLTKKFRGHARSYAVTIKSLSRYGLHASPWGPEGRAIVGAFLLDRVIESTGLVHIAWQYTRDAKRIPYVQPDSQVLDFLKQLPPDSQDPIAGSIRVTPPTPWSNSNLDTYNTGSIEGGLIRLPKYASTQRDELNLSWIPPHSLDRTISAANYLQSQPFTLSLPLAELLNSLWHSNRQDTAGLFPCFRNPAPIPDLLSQDDSPEAWKQRNRQAALAYNENRVNNPARIALSRTCSKALQLANHPLYFPITADYRGRLYTPGDLTYQGNSISRALTHFHPSISEPLSPDGLDWCLRSAAAAHQGRHLSFPDRLAWAQNNLDLIHTVASSPEDNLHLFSHTPDPWRFVAAAQAISSHLSNPSTPIGLPIYFDQSCSGLGHVAALTRDPYTASLTHLIPSNSTSPDLYSTIAEALHHQALLDAHAPLSSSDSAADQRKQRRALFWATNGVPRNIVKPIVIASPYGIRSWGIRNLIADQLLRKLKSQDPRDLVEKVDGPAIYLSSIISKVMKPHLKASEKLKTYLRSIARSIASTNKPLFFQSPSGFPVRDAQLLTTLKQFPTALNGRKFAYHHIQPDDSNTIDSKKLQSRIVANYIQSIDASLCINTINTLQSLSLPIATIHDCFATTPNHANTLHSTLLKEINSLHQQPLIHSFHSSVQSHYNIDLPSPCPLGKLDPSLIGSDPLLFS